MRQLPAKTIGALLGLLFGLLVVQFGFFKAVFVGVVMGIGWFVGRVLDGETNFGDLIRPRDTDDLE